LSKQPARSAVHHIDEKQLMFLQKLPMIVKTLPQRRHEMKINLSRFLSSGLVVVSLAFAAFSQSETISAAVGDKYVISAKAGGVNYVEGTVSVVRAAGTSGRLIKGDSIEIGDRISTGADARAEVLLNPGSYLRLGPSSTFEFVTTSLDDLNLKLDSGSAMFEVFASSDFAVNVSTPKAKFVLIDSGIYRIDVAANGSGVLSVWKGKAHAGNDTATIIKGGKEATVSGETVSVAKFDRGDKDDLETWSKSRAKELAKVSSNLKPRDLRSPLMRSFLGNRWDMYSSFGLWVYDPFRGAFCFLPFGSGWSSPYGYWFGQDIWYYRLPRYVYQQPMPASPTGGTTAGRVRPATKVRSDDAGAAATRTIEPTRSVPPFTRMKGDSGIFRNGGDDSGGFGPVRSIEPVRSTSVVVPSAPASSGATTRGSKKP
jgi:hypothetical protein